MKTTPHNETGSGLWSLITTLGRYQFTTLKEFRQNNFLGLFLYRIWVISGTGKKKEKNIMNGIVKAICISSVAGGLMQEVFEVEAIAGQGLKGDRYTTGEGSFNKDRQGHRQVTLMNAIFFKGSGFEFADSRRNIFVEGVELMWLIGREFRIGTTLFRGLKYCDPCNRPSKISGKSTSFKEAFFDRGGIVAEILEGGVIKVGDTVIPPPKGY